MGFIRQASLPFAALIAIIAIAIVGWLGICAWGKFTNSATPGENIWNWVKDNSTLTIGTITILFLIVAGILAGSQLKLMRESRYAELLMHLDERWESDQSVDIRYNIENKLNDIRKKLKKDKLDDTEIENRLGGKLSEIVKRAKDNSEKDYFLITSLLGFLETLAFLTRKEYIPLKDAKELFGAPMVNYYGLFENYIIEIRKESNNQYAYKELEGIVKNELRSYFANAPIKDK